MSSPEQPTPEDLQAESLTRDIAADMPSPYCPGRSIASCPTQAARELEDDIYSLAQQGQSREQIEQTLVARFGEDKMGKAQETEITVAIVLGAVMALGAIVMMARKWLRPAQAASVTAATAAPTAAPTPGPLAGVSADELDRLEDELDDIEGI